jgi:hypothetical protein
MDVANQEYADDQLNTLMKKYKENETERDEFYAKTKTERVGAVKPRGVVGPSGMGAAGATSEAPPTDMFGGDDLVLRRKKEKALAKAAEKVENIIHSS